MCSDSDSLGPYCQGPQSIAQAPTLHRVQPMSLVLNVSLTGREMLVNIGMDAPYYCLENAVYYNIIKMCISETGLCVI